MQVISLTFRNEKRVTQILKGVIEGSEEGLVDSKESYGYVKIKERASNIILTLAACILKSYH